MKLRRNSEQYLCLYKVSLKIMAAKQDIVRWEQDKDVGAWNDQALSEFVPVIIFLEAWSPASHASWFYRPDEACIYAGLFGLGCVC